jgi:multidrug resistance efflux pump
MPITLNSQRRRAFLFGRQTALRSASDVIDQLQAQLEAERKQHKFNITELEKQIATLLRDLMQAKYELAQRNLVETFVKMESPSARLH